MTSPTDRTGPGDGPPDRVARAIADWRAHLSDLGGDNALLWFRDLPDTTLDLTSAHPSGLAKLFSAGRAPLPELMRQPGALAEGTRRARTIEATAQRLYAVRGVSTCYLASGLAQWDIPGSARTPAAPVLLRPCRVEASHGDTPTISTWGPLQVNEALVAYLASECGIELDAARVSALASHGSGADPAAAFRLVTQACADVPAFRIDPRLVIGLFATFKLPLVRDLAETGDDLRLHPVVAALAGDPEAAEQVAALPPDTGLVDLDRELVAGDADLDQQDVVEAVRAGANLVVQGAPGTGKTQTAAHLIAALAADGRRTLLVSHQRAAVDAVCDRLADVGLEDLVLDAHAEHAAPGHLAAHLTGLLDRRLDQVPRGDAAPAELVQHLDALQTHVETMHCVRAPWGVSLDEAQSQISALEERKPAPRSRVRLTGDDLAGISATRREELRSSLHEIAAMEAWTSVGEPDPWFGARIVGAQQAERIRELVQRLGEGGLREYREHHERLCEKVGLPAPRTMREAQEQLDLMSQVHGTLQTFRPDIYTAPLDDMVVATADRDYRKEHGVDLGAMGRRRLRRQAASFLRPGPPPRSLHPVLVRAAAQRAEWREAAGPGSQPSAPAGVPDAIQEHERLREELEWLGERLERTREGGDLLEADLDALEDRLARLAAAPDRLAKVPKVIGSLDTLRANGLDAFIDDVAGRRLTPDEVVHEFDFVWWTSVLQHVERTDEAYREHDGHTLREIAAAYAQEDADQRARAVQRVRDSLIAQVHRTDRDLPDQSDLLRHEADSPGQHLTMHDLLEAAPELVGVLTPCWAMSPLEVPMHVPPGLRFDVVICDEASVIDPAEAISAISRGGQVVVLGDLQQLPPAPLQMTPPGDDGPPPRTAPQSLLDLLAPIAPMRALGTHYRCHDERLIAFSAAQLYPAQLTTFPSPTDDGALRLDVVSGSSTGGDSAALEVDHVVQLVLDHVHKRPDESLGVITLTHRHAQRVEDALRAAVAGRPAIAQTLQQRGSEPFFVRSVDHVQGEVRDATILSIGHGRGPDGEVPHRFGAVSAAGGERRLNVAITRARKRTVVVSSFSGGELEPSRLRSRGATMLRDFLLYAASGGSVRRVDGDGHAGRSAPPAPTVGPDGRRRRMASSGSVLDRPTLSSSTQVHVPPLVADLARRMRAEGLVVHTTHGAGPHRLDLAVEDPRTPGRLLMAVETDGPSYGSIRSPRDRDRLRVERLQQLGWAYERVWTRDLFRDPAQEVSRLVTAVHAASNARRRAGRRSGRV